MKRKKAVVIHLNPWYKFPPVVNLHDYIRDKYFDLIEIKIISTIEKTKKDAIIPQDYSVYQIKSDSKGVKKILSYIWLNTKIFLQLVSIRPEILMYYETISVAPVYLYSLFFRPKLFIHYHELMTKEEYEATGFQSYLHRLERKLYPKANWISHTNKFRLDYFIKDNSLPPTLAYRIFENFPSAQWSERSICNSNKKEGDVRIIYIGSLDLENMYIREFIQWIKTKEQLSLTIYSQNNGACIEDYCSALSVRNVFFKGFIPYHNIPTVLSEYNIGLIWYKPNSINFTFNAPNKLFEYYACGLEVWFPKELEGAYTYMKSDSDPRILPVDYSDINDLNDKFQSYSSIRKASNQPYYNYESVFERLIKQWLN